MPYKCLVNKTCADRAAILTELWSFLADAGWTLHDDQSGSSYRVYTSNGAAADRIYEYIEISWATALKITFRAWGYWDATGHAGSCGAYTHADFDFITTQEDTQYIWLYGDANLVILAILIGSTVTRTMFGHMPKRAKETPLTTLTDDATNGSSVSIEVASSTGFIAGKSYQIVGSAGEGRDWVELESVTDATHMVIATLPRNYGTGAKIGFAPSTFGVINLPDGEVVNRFYTTCPKGSSGTTDVDSEDVRLDLVRPLDATYMDPDGRIDKHTLMICFGLERDASGGLALHSYIDANFREAPLGSHQDLFLVKDDPQETGTATSGAASTLTDTSKTWTSNEWANKIAVITAGTGEGQTRKIASNTATQLTVATAWTTQPDATSVYCIVDEAYRLMEPKPTGGADFACKEII